MRTLLIIATLSIAHTLASAQPSLRERMPQLRTENFERMFGSPALRTELRAQPAMSFRVIEYVEGPEVPGYEYLGETNPIAGELAPSMLYRYGREEVRRAPGSALGVIHFFMDAENYYFGDGVSACLFPAAYVFQFATTQGRFEVFISKQCHQVVTRLNGDTLGGGHLTDGASDRFEKRLTRWVAELEERRTVRGVR